MPLTGGGKDEGVTLIGPPMAPPVELLRWLMQVHCLPHRFEPRAAGLHAPLQKKLGLPIELPLLLTPEGPIGGLRPAIGCVEGQLKQAGASLYTGEAEREWAEALTTELFPAAVQLFYAYMLKSPLAIIPPSLAGVPLGDRLAVTLGFPLWRAALRRGLKLETFRPELAEAVIRHQFDRVASELGGKNWLCGKRACFRDLLFAVLASPVILPPGHPATLPAMDSLPRAFRTRVESFRAHPAGQHALKVYATRGQADCPKAETMTA